MSPIVEVRLPDLGDADDVEVVEILVAPGDRVERGESLIVLESEKASTEIPSPCAGTVKELKVQVGSKVETGTLVCTLETSEEAATAEEAPASQAQAPAAPAQTPAAPASPEPKTPAPTEPASKPATGLTVILGGGPGGYEAALRLGALGGNVMLVERARVGGVCLHAGCIPSKALIDTAHRVHAMGALAGRGVSLEGKIAVDLKKLQAWKRGVLDRLTGFIEQACQRSGVQRVRGTGTLTGPHTLSIETPEGVRPVEFENCILATGSRAVELPGLAFDGRQVLSAAHALELEAIPETLLVVGGGYIGLELGIAFAKLGSTVTVVEMEGQLLPGTDGALLRPLTRRLKELGIAVHLGTRLTGFEGGRAALATKNGESHVGATHVLVAVGRRPNTDQIGMERAGLERDARGYLATNERKQTALAHIYAIGDITHGPALAHKAAAEGRVAAEVIAGRPSAFDNRAIPAVLFTDPEISTVGLSEAQAKEAGYEPRSLTLPNRGLGRALVAGESEGLCRLVYDEPTGLLLGAALAGGPATDMIGALALALEMGATVEDLSLTIFPHPTFSEQVMLAARRVLDAKK